MSAAVVLEGMAEFREALKNLPDDLVAEAGHIVEGAANGAAADIRGGYPVASGNLRDGVTATRQDGSARIAATSVVKSGSPHASIFENGTKTRTTKAGANRGRMPKPEESLRMIPKVIRARRRMQDDLVDMLRRQGFEVNL